MDEQIRVTERDLFEQIGRLNVANQLLQQRIGAVVAENAELRQHLAALAERAVQPTNGHEVVEFDDGARMRVE